ncbi:pyridoxamine 5'-phosphate oxidase-domain-containing protein [Thelephora terrestris]|uniref:Pyridoxamine 5'-phosphate oxidase-domain-containing protein n=1 Tax=Thelephora terrestris TaxID=56493 RepID=A0A9P6HRB9_9AGAM|nr:pyridoxamine 5'-phosphate oxidase-domain-containing protein [Thelephora terrestris]
MFSLNPQICWTLSLCLMLTLFPILTRGEETVFDAARISRRLVDSSPDSVGTFATIFPSDHPDLPGEPFSLQQYYASCHTNGSLALLFLPISRHSKNILRSANHSASLSVASPHPAAWKPRVSLIGSVTVFRDVANTPDEDQTASCYLKRHPDAVHWLPKDKHQPHVAYWARFDPYAIYFVGGFGSSHYIGYIPLELYQTALRPESPHDPKSIAGRILIDQTQS